MMANIDTSSIVGREGKVQAHHARAESASTEELLNKFRAWNVLIDTASGGGIRMPAI
jgi:hypothetical protein